MTEMPITWIALGGNAMLRAGQQGTAEEQLQNIRQSMQTVAEIARENRVVISHGNGPQVGNLLLQQEGTGEVPTMPLDVIGAMTQGQIGYMIESTLEEALEEAGVERLFSTVITFTIVDEDDPLFQNPTKPIGPFYTEQEAAERDYDLVETDKGYRRVVPSPVPVAIAQQREITDLVAQDYIVICCGGGGIPVIRDGSRYHGVEAVIDKDLASSRLARDIPVDRFIIATDVTGAATHWGEPEQEILGDVTVAELERYAEEGHFAAGSMGPKIQAIIEFVKETGNRGVICKLEELADAVRGETGTQVSA